jgi:hypothetical protein
LASGTFRLSFSSEPTALAAAREARTRGFDVDVACLSADCWQTSARARPVVPFAELHRYAGRLQRIADAFEGTYIGFTADEL